MSLAHSQFRQALEDGDIDYLVQIWTQVMPGLPKPESKGDAEIVMHVARTQTTNIAFRSRAYSHRWLTDRGLPSYLPDELKPKAERIYPKIVAGIGVAVITKSELFKPIAKMVEKAVCDAIEECHADGVALDSPIIKKQMLQARINTVKKLVGK